MSLKEMKQVVLSMKNKKAAGSKDIPAEVYKLVFHDLPLVRTFNGSLKGTFFPAAGSH